jgi:hypothetical protein
MDVLPCWSLSSGSRAPLEPILISVIYHDEELLPTAYREMGTMQLILYCMQQKKIL